VHISPMIITIAQHKGGVGKTTTAVHIASYLNLKAPTVLIDHDPKRNAIAWVMRGGDKMGLKAAPGTQGVMLASKYEYMVNDTKAREDGGDLADLAEGCDLLIIPVEPGTMEYETTLEFVETLRKRGVDPTRYRVLITKVPPHQARDGDMLYEALTANNIPVFKNRIRLLKAFRKAVESGLPVYAVKYPLAEEAWNDYQRVCEEILL
jgi:chromosome partitioning protein